MASPLPTNNRAAPAADSPASPASTSSSAEPRPMIGGGDEGRRGRTAQKRGCFELRRRGSSNSSNRNREDEDCYVDRVNDMVVRQWLRGVEEKGKGEKEMGREEEKGGEEVLGEEREDELQKEVEEVKIPGDWRRHDGDRRGHGDWAEEEEQDEEDILDMGSAVWWFAVAVPCCIVVDCCAYWLVRFVAGAERHERA